MLPRCICAECAGAGPHFERERRVRVGGAGAGDAARAAVRGGRSGSTAAYGGAALIVATVAGGRTLPVPLQVQSGFFSRALHQLSESDKESNGWRALWGWQR